MTTKDARRDASILQESQPRVKVKFTKLEKIILEAVRTAPLGLPDWQAIAKAENVPLDYLMQRVDWLRAMRLLR